MKEAIKNYNYDKLKDQFTTPTRNVRRNLLVSSALAITLIMIGSNSIESLFGIKFSDDVPIYIPLGMLSIVVLYEFVAFIIYASVDHISWSLRPYEVTYKFTQDNLNKLTENVKLSSEKINMHGVEELKNMGIPIHSIPIHVNLNLMPIDTNPGHENLPININDKIQEYIAKEEEKITEIFDSEIKNIQKEVNNLKNQWLKNLNKNIENYNLCIEDVSDIISSYDNEMKEYCNKIGKFNLLQKIRIYLIDWGLPVVLGILSLYINHGATIEFINKIWSTVTLCKT